MQNCRSNEIRIGNRIQKTQSKLNELIKNRNRNLYRMVLILKFKCLFNWFSWEKSTVSKSLHAIRGRFSTKSNCKLNLPDKVSQSIWRYCLKEVCFFVQFWLPCNLQWSIQVHHQAPTSLVSTIMLNNFVSTDHPRIGFTCKEAGMLLHVWIFKNFFQIRCERIHNSHGVSIMENLLGSGFVFRVYSTLCAELK